MSKREKLLIVKLTRLEADAIQSILDDALNPQKGEQYFYPVKVRKFASIVWRAKDKIDRALSPEDYVF